MTNSSSLQFYLARADEARSQAEAATLSHVRERCRRSEAAWMQLANRAAANERSRARQIEEKAAAAASHD